MSPKYLCKHGKHCQHLLTEYGPGIQLSSAIAGRGHGNIVRTRGFLLFPFLPSLHPPLHPPFLFAVSLLRFFSVSVWYLLLYVPLLRLSAHQFLQVCLLGCVILFISVCMWYVVIHGQWRTPSPWPWVGCQNTCAGTSSCQTGSRPSSRSWKRSR